MIIRNLTAVLALSFVVGCAGTSVPVPSHHTEVKALRERLLSPGGDVMVIAHRACFARGAPENSLAAIRQCMELDVDMIEIDVALSSDGVPVLMHDQTLDRMTEVTGNVSDYSIEELVSFRLRARQGSASEPLTSETIPTLREALELVKGHSLINLDIKGEAYAPAFDIVSQLNMGNQILMKMTASPDDAALVKAPFLGQTFFMPVIRQCTEYTSQGSCAPVLSEVVLGYDNYSPVAYEITFIDLGYLVEGIPEMLARDKRIWVNTLEPHHAAGLVDRDAVTDPDAVWGALVDMGVDMIQTDNPSELIIYLRSRGLRD